MVLGLAISAVAHTPSSRAAMNISRPALELPQPDTAEAQSEAGFAGRVIFVRGSQIVAEIDGGARDRERLIVYDSAFRRRGTAVVVKALDAGVFLLNPGGSLPLHQGDLLARESEAEAAARVFRENETGAYREFLELFPRSEHRPRVTRELFRLAMADYPTFPGSVIQGRIRLTESVGREISLDHAQIVLDRYVITRTEGDGRFRIEGLPKLREPVTLTLRVKDEKFQVSRRITVDLRSETVEELSVELPIQVTPTVLAGKVVDEHGAPLAAAEIWTHPYTMEVLTDDEGTYRISRRKKLESAVSALGSDEPAFGGEYEVYAYRRGYSVDRVAVSAESYRENPVPDVRLTRQDPWREEIPDLGLDLRAHVQLDSSAAAIPQGAGPKINR